MSDSLETSTKSPKQRSRHWLSPEDWKVACEIAAIIVRFKMWAL